MVYNNCVLPLSFQQRGTKHDHTYSSDAFASLVTTGMHEQVLPEVHKSVPDIDTLGNGAIRRMSPATDAVTEEAKDKCYTVSPIHHTEVTDVCNQNQQPSTSQQPKCHAGESEMQIFCCIWCLV